MASRTYYCKSITHAIGSNDPKFNFSVWYHSPAPRTVPQCDFNATIIITLDTNNLIDDSVTVSIIDVFKTYCILVSRSNHKRPPGYLVTHNYLIPGSEIERFIDELKQAVKYLELETVYLNNYFDKRGLPRDIEKKEWDKMSKEFKTHIINRKWDI